MTASTQERNRQQNYGNSKCEVHGNGRNDVQEQKQNFREAAESRAKKVALYTIQAVALLDKTQAACVLGDNAVKSAVKIGSLYRKTAFAKNEDFILRTESVLSQCDDTIYWLELIEECGAAGKGITDAAMKEAKEFASMVGAGLKKIKENSRNKQV